MINTEIKEQKKENFSHKKFWKRKKKEEELIKEVEALGIKSQVEVLQKRGFYKVKKIIKALIRNNVDLEKAAAFLESKRAKWGVKAQQLLDLNQQLNDLKLESAVEKVKSDHPHMPLKRIVKYLSESQNDPEKVNEVIKQSFLKRKEEKYQQLFPGETEIDWEKFKQKKEELKTQKRLSKYQKLFPGETEVDWEKFQQKKAELKTQKKLGKYKQLFPGDTEVDWEKFKTLKKQLRVEKFKKLSLVENYLIKEVKPGLTTIYLDGNNMLFIDNTLRSLCLKKKIKSACEKLANLSASYSLKILKINTHLIFDRENKEYDTESDGVKFSVRSATPNYETSDDALVDWAGGLSASDLANSLFMTSDRGLQTRLLDKGAVNFMKSKVWLTLVKQGLGEENFNQILTNEH